MRITSQGAILELERSELGPPGTPAEDDLLLNVTVEVRGFAAADQSWIVASDWTEFLREMRRLDAERSGKAVQHGASPEDLRIEFFSTDRAGHMAVCGHLRRPGTAGALDLRLEFGFAFEPDSLPEIVEALVHLSA